MSGFLSRPETMTAQSFGLFCRTIRVSCGSVSVGICSQEPFDIPAFPGPKGTTEKREGGGGLGAGPGASGPASSLRRAAFPRVDRDWLPKTPEKPTHKIPGRTEYSKPLASHVRVMGQDRSCRNCGYPTTSGLTHGFRYGLFSSLLAWASPTT